MIKDLTLKIADSEQEVAAAKRIRFQVFIEEQGIPAHLDDDGLDDSAYHAVCCIGNRIVGTGRLVSAKGHGGVLGRIAIIPEFRGQKLGNLVVKKLEMLAVQLGLRELTLHPHKRLESFYEILGYRKVAGTYWAGPHELITMRKTFEERDNDERG